MAMPPKRAAKATAKPRKPQVKAKGPKTQQKRSKPQKKRSWIVLAHVVTSRGGPKPWTRLAYLTPERSRPVWTFDPAKARRFHSELAACKVAAKNHANVSLEVA